MSRTRIRAVSEPWYASIAILVAEVDFGGTITAVAPPVVMSPAPDRTAGEPIEATARITLEAAQALMDDLWNAGVRPTEARTDTGTIEAMRAHLQDMRRLVFAEADAVRRAKE